MQFDGEMNFEKKPQQIWSKLSDVRFLVQAIPDVEDVAKVEEDHAECKIRPNIGFVRGAINLTIQRTELDHPHRIAYKMTGKGIGSSSVVETKLTLEDHNGGTKVLWIAIVSELGGLLKAIPKGLISGAAKKTINDIWAGVSAKITEQGSDD